MKLKILGVVLACAIAVPFLAGAVSSAPCACCGADCVCENCQCDELGCACSSGGECVCDTQCCATCCGD